MRKLSIGLMTLGVLLTLGVLRAIDLRTSRAETLRTAEVRAANLALIASAHLLESLEAADASLRQLAIHSRRIGGPPAPRDEWAPSLAAARAGLTSTGAITVVDAEGRIRHSTRPQIVGESRGDEWITHQVLTATTDDLVVGTPFPTIAVPPQVIIPIARRLIARDGTVAGAVVASFVPAELRSFFRTLNVGTRGTVWVIHPDGVILFREPSAGNPIGDFAKDNRIFEAALRSRAGVLEGAVEPGGGDLLTAFHAAEASRLIAAVSLNRDEVLAAWSHEAQTSVAAFVVIASMLVAMLRALYRQMDEKTAAERGALEREQSARRAAEDANALKDQFLMTVSHELRTPLTAIAGWARMLVEGAVGEGQKETALRTIERNALAQSRLVEELLDLSHAMSGRLRLDVREAAVADVIAGGVETIRPAAAAKGIRLETAVDPAVGLVSGDAGRLEQAIGNLLSNAVKFTPDGGRIVVSAARAGDWVELSVSDTGIGISPEFLPHVFDRFRQEDSGTKRRYGGLGLGLAIVRHMVELHGGSVAARSEGPGRGATFTIRLPAVASENVQVTG